jgi:hypothetical protein
MPQTNYDATTAASWQLNAESDGPKIADEGSGALGIRTAAGALAVARGAAPLGDDDLSPRVYVAKRLIPHAFTLAGAVPASGTRVCSWGGIAMSTNPIVPAFAGTVRGIAVRVDVNTDPKSYAVEVLVQGVVVDTLVLPATTYQAIKTDTVGAFSANQRVQVRVKRTSGTGASVWTLMTGTLYLRETVT